MDAQQPSRQATSASTPELNLSDDVVALTAALVDVPSESRHEQHLADLVEAALVRLPHLRVDRLGNTVVARTDLGRADRVVLAGHLDTVPAADNLPHRIVDGMLYGLGACDMKGGVAVGLRCAAELAAPVRDVTYVFYESEEIDDAFNGLRAVAEQRPEWIAADFAVLMEPSNASVEAGCQGTMRFDLQLSGRRSHSARSWLGDNAIHKAAEVLARLNSYQARTVDIDGLTYREGLNATGIRGGVAGNVIPDEAAVSINYRFAPDRSGEQAEQHMREVFAGFPMTVLDLSPGALPGLQQPAARDFIAAVGAAPAPKFGWTDVARFSAIGVPAVNFGPGDPSLAHTREEHVPVAHLRTCEQTLMAWLAGRSAL